LDEGDVITVTHGAETYQLGPFASFTTGPVSLSITIRKGEAIDQAYARAHRVLDVAFEAEFELKRHQYFQRAEAARELGKSRLARANG
jgi:hypothetical protein